MTPSQAQTLQWIEPVWKRHCQALQEALRESKHALEELMRLDEHHRRGHDPEELGHTLGPLAADQIDLSALSRTLERGVPARAMSTTRLARIHGLLPDLQRQEDFWSSAALEESYATLDDDEANIVHRARAHFDRLSAVFRLVRAAQLEIRSKYEPAVHDAVFAHFDWQELGPGELRLSPPFVITSDFDTDVRQRLRKVVALLETGMPIKFLALRSEVRAWPAAPGAGGLGLGMTLETLPLAMWGVYLVQTPSDASDFEERLSEALTSPRAAVISLLCPRTEEAMSAFSERAERAVRARAFPRFVHDPDRGDRVGLCVDLSANPDPAVAWLTDHLVGRDAEGVPFEIDEPFTFAHFAAGEPGFEKDFSPPAESADRLVALTDYLALSRTQRVGKLPFIRRVDENGRLFYRIVSDELVEGCAERLHVWRTLQEISGIDNPHVNRTRRELGGQQTERLRNLREELEKQAADRERDAVASAVRKLVARLTGVDPAGG